MPVDILPGAHDLSNVMLPQQPLASCLLPQATRVATCHLVSNPYLAAIAKVSFLGTSGQPVDSVLQCSQGLTPLAALEQMLMWRHVAPTAPDILGMMTTYGWIDSYIYVYIYPYLCGSICWLIVCMYVCVRFLYGCCLTTLDFNVIGQNTVRGVFIRRVMVGLSGSAFAISIIYSMTGTSHYTHYKLWILRTSHHEENVSGSLSRYP